MLTDSVIAHFADMAGDDFSWSGVRGGNRPPSKYLGRSGFRSLLKADLIARQGGICPQCGDALTGPIERDDVTDVTTGLEFCHIVSRGPGVKGFHPGNVFVGHPACNASTKPIHDEAGNVLSGVAVLLVDMLARPDAVPMEWTPFPVLARTRS